MLKHIKYIFAAAMALLFTGCSDELLWDGNVDSETEIVIPFRESPMTDVSASTRAFSSISTNVKHISLLIFDSDGNYVEPTKSEFDLSSSSTDTDVVNDVNGQKGIKIKRSNLSAGCTVYLVANAEEEVENFKGGNHSETDFISYPIAKNKILGTNSDGADVENAIMTGRVTLETVPEAGSLSMPTVALRRLFSWIDFKVDKSCKEFLVTGVKLYMVPEVANFDGSASTTVVENPYGYISTPLNGQEGIYKYLISSDAFKMYTLPISSDIQSPSPSQADCYPEARLLIKGIYRTELDPDNGNAPVFDGNSKECWYSYAFPSDVAANHHITLTLKDVSGIGADDEESALENPSKVVIKYEDKEDDINNIVSDGEHVIALPDTIYADPDATEFNFNVIWRAKKDENIDITNLEEVLNTSWLTLSENGSTTSITTSAAESNLELTRNSTPYKVSLTQNNGSERDCTIKFTIKDNSDNTHLNANMVIVQKAPASINLDNDISISLTISGAYYADIGNYLQFIGNNPETGTSAKVKGLAPEENGGRIRNAGLHMPMPNGGSTKYTYKIWADNGSWTLKNNWSGKITLSEGSGSLADPWIIEFTDSDNKIGDETKSGNDKLWEYVVAEDALEFSNGTKTLTLDLYHTGLFHKVGNDYYYYEVFKAGNQIWLDRNIGATSAGMAHLTDSYARGSWPMSVASAGSVYTFTEAKSTTDDMIPKGWRLPSQGDFEAMAMQGNFSSNRMTAGGVTFFAPTYRFSVTTVKKDLSRRASNINAYFPHNRIRTSTGKIGGDDGAGYYWTSTGTSSEDYKRVMKFSGQNMTAADFMYGKTENNVTSDLGNKMSLRCVAGENNNVAYTYSCQVKGYTHAFIYYQDKNGAKTYLNTWPGTEIAVRDMATKKYCPFKFETFVDYPLVTSSTDNGVVNSPTGNGEGLYVIFNNPSKEAADEDYSNVNAAARADRRGIPFMNGWAYDINMVGTAKLVYPNDAKDYVVKGNWTKTPISTTRTVKVVFRAPIGSTDTNIRDRLYMWDENDTKLFGNWPGEFKKGEKNGYYYWEKTMEIEKTETPSDVIKAYLFTYKDSEGDKNTTDDINWSGHHTEVTDAATKQAYDNCDYLYTIWATGTTEPTQPEYKYYVYGNIWNGSTWSYNTTDWSRAADGSCKYSNVTVHNGKFGIGKFELTQTDINADSKKGWIAASSDTEATPGNSVGNSKTISLKADGSDIELSAGTYDIVISSDGSSVTVTRKVAVTYDRYYVKLIGVFNDWKDAGQHPDSNGKVVFENKNIGNGEFRIEIWDTVDEKDRNYSTGNYIDQDSWISLTENNSNSMHINNADVNSDFTVEWDQVNKKLKVTRVYRYTIRGSMTVQDWSDFSMNDDDGDGIWTCSVTPTRDNWNFGIKQINVTNDNQVAWLYKSGSSNTISYNTDMSVIKEGGGTGTNWEGSGKSTLTFYFNPSTMKLKVTK